MVAMIIGTEIDDNSIREVSNNIQRRFDRLSQDVGNDFMSQFADAATANSPKIQKAIDRAADATGRLRSEQEKLDALASRGVGRDRIVAQSEKVAKARRDEARAVREAADATKEYAQAGDQAGDSFLSGLSGAVAGAGTSGQDMANEFVGGFAGASMLTRLGAAAGPIGLALAGTAALGVVAGRQLATGIADGLATIQMQDMFQARMGLNEAAMSEYADAAGRAFANNFGMSVADNLGTAQAALRSGLIGTNATDAQVQGVIEQLQGVATTTDATIAELSRSTTTLMRTGLAGSVSDASDIITAGFQAGLDVSGDWLDTVNEYSTQFRKFGLDASQVLTLLNQGIEGGARDTDKVADSLKEFAIRAVDGSKSTKEGFEALGYSADDMAARFAAGGESAQIALDATFDAIRRINDPMQQALIWQRLFGTQFEDMGDAINHLDLDPAKNEFRDIAGVSADATRTATDNWTSEWDEAMRTAQTRFADFKTWLADEFTDLPGIKQLPDLLKWALTPPGADRPTGPSGPAPPGYTPTSPLPAIAPRPQGPGLGPFPVNSSVDNVLDALVPAPAPSTPTDPAQDMEWDWRTGGLVPATPRTDALPGGITQGTPVPILTDAQAEAQKEAAAGGSDRPVIDPSRYSLDSVPIQLPGGMRVDQLPGIGTVGAPTQSSAMQAPSGYGQFEVDPQKVFDAETSLISQRQSVENARLRLLELEAEGTATQGDINAAKTAVTLAERQYISAQQKIVEAQQGTWQKMEDTARSFASGMEGIGAALDADFGISDGLPGLAENLTRFIGSLAAAPLLGPLSAIKDSAGDEGSGLMGMLASSGAFGPRFMPTVDTITAAATASNVGGPSALQSPLAASDIPASKFSDAGLLPAAAKLNDIVAAYFPQITDIGGYRQDPHPDHPSGRALDIMIPGGTTRGGANPQGKALGDQIWSFLTANGLIDPVGSLWQTDTGGDHFDHIHARVPEGMENALPGVAMPPGVGLTAGPDFPVPLPVVIVGGGFPAIGAPAGLLPGPGAGPALGPAVAPTLGGSGPLGIPGPSASGGLPSLPPLPAPGGVPGGGSTLPGTGMPGAAPFMSPPGTPANPIGSSLIPGQSPGAIPGAGGGMSGAIGGIPLAAAQAGASSLDMLAPGAGAAANLGIQLANRSIGAAGQQIGNLWSGLFETFSLSGSGGATDPLKTLPGRLLAGIAGARPSIPNSAGGGVQQSERDPRQQRNPQQGQGGGPLVEIHGGIHQQPGQEPDSVANSVANQISAAEHGSGWMNARGI